MEFSLGYNSLNTVHFHWWMSKIISANPTFFSAAVKQNIWRGNETIVVWYVKVSCKSVAMLPPHDIAQMFSNQLLVRGEPILFQQAVKDLKMFYYFNIK
jgi:hypothetical protein